MKENLEISLKLALKFKQVFNYAIDKQSALVQIEKLSDEMADTLLFQIEVFKSLDLLLDEVIDVLNNRIRIFGKEGLEKENLWELNVNVFIATELSLALTGQINKPEKKAKPLSSMSSALVVWNTSKSLLEKRHNRLSGERYHPNQY